MAKFLCDKCGKEVEVSDAEQVRGFDLCHECATAVQKALNDADELINRKMTATAQLNDAVNFLLNRLQTGEELSAAVDVIKTFAEIIDHCTSAESADNDVLKVLGIK